MKIIIRSPLHKQARAELSEVYKKICTLLKKRNFIPLQVFTPVYEGNTLTLEFRQTEHVILVLNELRWLLAQKATWNYEVLR
jgi:hypothetical protein